MCVERAREWVNGIDLSRVCTIDFESAIIRPGLPAPPPTVLSVYMPSLGAHLYMGAEMGEWIEKLLRSEYILVGHNIAYDVGLIIEWYPELVPLVIGKYNRNEILDTMLVQRIIEICMGDMRGQLSLERLCARVGIEMKHKNLLDVDGEKVQMGFGKHYDHTVDDLTDDEYDYCIDDTVDCWELFRRLWSKGWVDQTDAGKLARTDLSLKIVSGFGMRADETATHELELEAREIIAEATEIMLEWGLMRRERDGSTPRNMSVIQYAVADAYNIATYFGEGRNRNKLYVSDPDSAALGLVTDTGAVSTNKTVLAESGDPILAQLGDLQEWLAVVNKDLKIFHGGIFHTRFGYANTLRTTSSRPNIQNFRRKAGIRECIYPYFGAFVAADYVGLENGTLAQCCVDYCGDRRMADKISAGWDFHCEVGALIRGCSYEEFRARLALEDANPLLGDNEHERPYKFARGCAKPANFGLPGYMTNPKTFQAYARMSYGVRLTLEQATIIMRTWHETQHCQVGYLRHVDTFAQDLGGWSLYDVPIPRTKIIRHNATRTAAANTGFQALGMQCAGEALWLVVCEQLLGRFPGRLCGFVHDELVADCKPSDIDQIRHVLEAKMIAAAEKLLPDVQMRVESIAMDRLSKVAKHKEKDGHLLLQRIIKQPDPKTPGRFVYRAAA